MDIAETIKEASNSGASLRTGRVVGLSYADITVDIGSGQQVQMPYLFGYQPILGDNVQVLQQGAANLAVGRAVGDPSNNNLLVDPSFELDPAGRTPPTYWSVYNDPAYTPIPTVKVDRSTAFAPLSAQWLAVNLIGGISITYISSRPLEVRPDDAWTAAAFWTSSTPENIETPTIDLRLAWFNSAASTYPNTVAADTVLDTQHAPNGGNPVWALLRDTTSTTGIVGPASATYVRAVIKIVTRGDMLICLDNMILRKVAG